VNVGVDVPPTGSAVSKARLNFPPFSFTQLDGVLLPAHCPPLCPVTYGVHQWALVHSGCSG